MGAEYCAKEPMKSIKNIVKNNRITLIKIESSNSKNAANFRKKLKLQHNKRNRVGL